MLLEALRRYRHCQTVPELLDCLSEVFFEIVLEQILREDLLHQFLADFQSFCGANSLPMSKFHLAIIIVGRS